MYVCMLIEKSNFNSMHGLFEILTFDIFFRQIFATVCVCVRKTLLICSTRKKTLKINQKLRSHVDGD